MSGDLVERFSGNLRYYVNPKAASDIYFDKCTLDKLNEEKINLSVTGISNYLRNKNTFYSPVLLTWDMTSRCNFECPFCYIRDNNLKREVEFDEAKKMIDGLVDVGLFEAYMSGGECLLVRDFLEIYKYFKQKGVFVTVFTNGSMIDDKVLDCWREYPPSSVEITLYDDNFESKPYCNILKLLDIGIFVLPKFTLTKTTLNYLEKVKKWTEKVGLSLSIDANIFDGLDSMHSGLKERYSIDNDKMPRYVSNKYYAGKNVFGKKTGFPCKSKKGIIQISPDFTLSLCNKMKKRWDLRKVDIEVAIEELRMLIKEYESVVIQGCAGCDRVKACEMCYANAELIDKCLYVPKGYCEKILTHK